MTVAQARECVSRAYRKECARIGLSRSGEEAAEDVESALSCFFVRSCRLGGEMRSARTIAVYAVRDVLFRENRKTDRERWSAEADRVCFENPDDGGDVEELFTTAREAVKTYSFRVFCKRLLRCHDAAELADSVSSLYAYFKRHCLTKNYF